MLKIYEEKIHSIIILSIVTLFIGHALLFSSQAMFVLIVVLQVFLLIYCEEMNSLLIVKILIGAILFSSFASFFIIFSPSTKFLDGEYVNIFGIKVFNDLIKSQSIVFYRVTVLTFVSFSSMRVIKFEKVIIFLMQNGYFSKRLGYPLILSINSVKKIRQEFNQIRINAKMRNLGVFAQWNIFIPLLVFAIRHGDRGAQSLITRGLNEDKLFYYRTEIDLKSKLVFILFFLLLFVCDIILLT